MQLVDTPLQAVTRTIQCEVAEMEFLRRKAPQSRYARLKSCLMRAQEATASVTWGFI